MRYEEREEKTVERYIKAYKIENLEGDLVLLNDGSLIIDWSDESCWGEDNIVSANVMKRIAFLISKMGA